MPIHTPPLVIIESPFAGDVETNITYARAALLDSLTRGECPFASHLLYTQVLADADDAQRRQGIAAGLAWGAHASLTAVYTDLGITEGMRFGIIAAGAAHRPIEWRSIR